MFRRFLVIFVLIMSLLNFPSHLKAELILAEGKTINLLSCNKIYDRFYLLYGKWKDSVQEVFLEEFTLDWRKIGEKRLDINGASADLAYFNDRFYVAYTSFEKEGNVRIAEFNLDGNLIRDILVTPTPYDGEEAYQLIPLGNNRLYLFYARNWQNDCGLKMVEFNRYLEPIQKTTLMGGNINFHAHQASDFSAVFAMDRFHIAYKKYSPLKLEKKQEVDNRIEEEIERQEEIKALEKEIEELEATKKFMLEKSMVSKLLERKKLYVIEEAIKARYFKLETLKNQQVQNNPQVQNQEERISMDIFVNEYNFSGELIKERCIDRIEKLSPSLFFDNSKFYLAYEGYDDNTNKHIIYICQYDTNWNLIKKIKIVTPETGAPREKVVIASESKCYLVSISQGENLRNRIFLKEINFDLETDEVRL